MKNFLFSFIIPCWNVGKYISEAVESVLTQSIGFKENIQIVLINDGSTDGTSTICGEYRKRYPGNITILANPTPRGVNATRNMGLATATGRYINFLEPGDKWEPEACKAALDFFGQHPEINVAVFPITLFGTSKGTHWLNYKFTETRVANIFKEPDSAVLDLCSCFCARETVKTRSFDEKLPISDESAWIAKLLLDEQNFALIAKPFCHCHSTPSSAAEIIQAPPSRYADSLYPDLDTLRHAKERYGETPEWVQYTVMLNLCRRFREEERDTLTPAQKEKYRELMRNCLEQIDDRIICTVRNLWSEDRLLALALKHGTTYEQIREWVKTNGEKKSLHFCRPDAESEPFTKPWELCLESMDVARGQLLLRGSCTVLVAPLKRMRLVLTVASLDGSIQEYPCELLRLPALKKRRLLLENDFWPREGFELALPLADQTDIRAFVEIDGLRFDLKWLHRQKSPFVGGDEQLHWERAGHAISQLPNKTGLHVESWRGEDRFLFSFIISSCNAKSYLTEAVESVLTQTIGFGENIQIVLVNDGNTDSMGAICKHYKELWPNNVILIDSSGDSPATIRNTGLKAASGRYINFLEPGDKWAPETCEAALDFFGQHPEINVAVFPITLLGADESAHWLNYKFTETRIVNIFREPDSAVLDLCSCFCARETVKNRPFDEDLPISDESAWIAKLLLDEQNFALIAKPFCRCRSPQSSAEETVQALPSRCTDTLRPALDILHHAKEHYGETPEWAQYTVMLNLGRRFREEDRNILTSAQKEKYRELMRNCLKQIDDRIICTVWNLWSEDRLIALALKHGMTYEQIREWVKTNGEEKSLHFCRPGAESEPFTKPWELCLEFMDVAGGQLLLRGSCIVLVAPLKRMRLVLTVASLDGSIQEYPCELLRLPALRKRRLLLKDDFWLREGFELALPFANLTSSAEIRAFIEIDGLRFDLKWLHKQKSPFVGGGEQLDWERAGHTVSQLPDKTGLRVEPWRGEDRFLFSFIIPAYNTKPYLAEAVESVLAQTINFEENIQIVLVNNDSTESTDAMCKRYRDLWPNNIVLVDLPGSGMGAARNAGLKAATGRYINFLEPDNKWDPNACETVLNFFRQHPEINIACFPITLFGAGKGAHWLNYKFTKTRVANILKDTDSAVLDLCSCFCVREVVKNRSFDEDLPISDESAWIVKLLLDEQNFALIAKPFCRCRSTQSSATEAVQVSPSRYADTLRPDLDILRHAKKRYGEAPEWVQYTVMLNLCRRLREENRDIFTPAQRENYQRLIRDCLEQIVDRIICTVQNPWPEERLLALALKHGMTYEQIKEWVKPNEEEKSLHFCRPGAEPVSFTKPWELWLESMDIAGGQLLLRGSYAVLVTPPERMRLVLTAISPDDGIKEYRCELLRRPDLKKSRLLLENNFWPREGFELTLPFADLAPSAEIRAFIEIDGLRFDLEWLHKQKSPFAGGDKQLYWERAGHTVSQLPDKTGLRVEPWRGENKFLFSFIIPAYNVKPYLAEAVESVLAQTIGFEENIQIVLVNDGSTDGTDAVCKRYQASWPENIIYIDKPNGGVSSARNVGLKAATGRYINFLDADDKWDPDACEAALDFFEKNPEVNIVCFPIMFFDRLKGAHWLNYKFGRTKVANIFNDTDYALYHVITCFIRADAAKAQPFDERLAISEDIVWLGTLLLNERLFGVISKPSYRYRKRFDQSSAIDMKAGDLSYYMVTPSLCFLKLFHLAREKYGEMPLWIQHFVMLDLTWRIKQEDDDFLTSDQKKEYQELMRACLALIDDQIILKVRNLWWEERLCTLALKYDMPYEQTKEWIIPDKETGTLYFCRPNTPPIEITRIESFRVEFMDISDGRLLLRGSCPVPVPRERMTFVLEMVHPDGGRREYPGELSRKIHRKKHSFFENEIWAMESFELSLPLIDRAKVQAFVNIDGIRIDLKWQHEKFSPFVRGNEASYLARAGYIIGKLPNDEGLFVESWTGHRAQDLERVFLGQVARKSNTIQAMMVTRIRRAARKMRHLSKKPIWLLSDRIAFAGDNGEALFEYLMAHPEVRQGIRPIFVLSKESEDWERLKQIGPIVADGSVWHKILFLAADKVISSSADYLVINPFGKDDWVYRDLFNFDFVFLQHGVIKDDLSLWLNRANRNLALFVTSARQEWLSVVEGDYDYTANQILLSGLPRHDKLLRRATIEKTQRLVAVMPTWRQNLVIARDPLTGLSLPNPAFETSEYFQFWNGLLNHPRLLKALREYDYRLLFAIHPQSTLEGSKFKAPDPVEIVFHCDYPKTFCEAALLVTDYSSVAFDFALLRKPLVYAHFDYDTFFSGHLYTKGYFDYKRDGFGPVCPDLETTADTIIRFLENGCAMESMYREREDIFFGVQPENRCQTVIDAIKKLGRRPQ